MSNQLWRGEKKCAKNKRRVYFRLKRSTDAPRPTLKNNDVALRGHIPSAIICKTYQGSPN